MTDVFQLDYFYCHLVKVPHIIFALLTFVHQKGMFGNACFVGVQMNKECNDYSSMGLSNDCYFRGCVCT